MEKVESPRRPYKKRTGFFESFDGTKIYFESRGEGPTLLLTYGIGCLINHWRYQIEYFSQFYNTVIYDIRGHHKSDIPIDRENIKIDCIAEDMLLLAEHLGVETFSAWGHSFGCPIILSAYKQNPEKFNSIVFVNGFSHNPFEEKFELNKLKKMNGRMRLYNEYAPELMDFVWKKGITSPVAIPLSGMTGGFNLELTPHHDIEIYSRGLSLMDPDVFARCFLELITWDGRQVLPKIKVPTLIVTGDRDQITPTERQELLHEEIHGSEFLQVPYGSHCTQLDLPDLVNLRIEKFLKDHF